MKTSLLKISVLALFSLSLLLLTFSIQAATTVLDTFIDGEAGTDGTVVTTTIATDATHGVTGSWSTVPSGGLDQLFISTAKISPLRGPVKVGSTTYDGSGSTRSFRMHNTVSDQHFAKYSFTTTKGKVSVGFAIYLSSAGAGWGHSLNLFDLFGMNGAEAGGDFLRLLHTDGHTDGATLDWRAHTQTESNGSTEVFHPVQDKWYWVTVLWDRPGLLGTIKVYDMDTWLVVGHMNSVLHDEDCNYVSIGRCDSNGLGSNIDADYYVDNFMIDFTTALFPLLPVGGRVLAASSSLVDVNRAYTNTVVGDNALKDTLFIPAGSNEWTSQLNIDRTIYIKGAGSNANQTVIQLNAGTQDSIFRCNSPFTEVSDIQFRGVDQANSGWLLRFPTNWCKAHDCHFTQALSATIMDGFSLVYNCSFLNCTRMGRAFGPGSGQYNWDHYAPINFASTNFAVWEDNTFAIDAGMPAALKPQSVITSQQGALWIARFNTLNIANFGYAPFFDSHGETDPGLRGNIGIQVYGNDVTMTGTSDWDKFVDIRGGAAYVYSNSVTGWSSSSGVYMRKKDGETANYDNDPVTNVWIFDNLMDGTQMPAVVEANDASIIVLHTHYEVTKPSPLLSIPYPHPLRTGGGGGGGPPPSGIAFVQSKSKDAGTITSTTLAFTSANTAGDLIIVGVRQGGIGTCAVTDSVGNTYALAQSLTAPSNDHLDYVFYAKNVGAGANTVTVTFEAGHTCRMAIHEYAGLSTTAPLDVKTGTTGTSTALDSGTVTTSSSSELLFGFGSVNNAETFTAGTGYTLRESPVNKIGTEDRIVSSSSTYSASFSISASDAWAMQIITFK